MNIFFLDTDPYGAAHSLCDKHVPKMLLESCQMLSTAIQRHTGRNKNLYKPAYEKHPMTIWVGDTIDNFNWAFENALWISDEYECRFHKKHKSSRILDTILSYGLYKEMPKLSKSFTNPPQCMPEEYQLPTGAYVSAYRKYYQGAKAYFAKWERGVSAPEWWVHA